MSEEDLAASRRRIVAGVIRRRVRTMAARATREEARINLMVLFGWIGEARLERGGLLAVKLC